MSFDGNYYAFVVMDDCSRYIGSLFLTHIKDMFISFKKFPKVIQNKKGLSIASIQSDNEDKFQNMECKKNCN